MSNRRSKTMLISGASSGIGEDTARHLATLGHPVVLGARRTQQIAAMAKQIEKAGGTALSHELDVTDLKSFKAFVAAAQNRFGSIDVLVNNGGVMPLSFMAELRVDVNELIVRPTAQG